MKHYLIGAFKNLMDAEVAKDSLDWVVLKVAVTTVHLERVVHNVKAFVGCEFFGHGTIHCVVRITLHNTIRSMSHHKSTSLKICRHFSKLKLNILIGSQRLPKLFSLFHIIFCNLKTLGSSTERATRDIEATTIKTR